jgi:hypothetical protein
MQKQCEKNKKVGWSLVVMMLILSYMKICQLSEKFIVETNTWTNDDNTIRYISLQNKKSRLKSQHL